MIVPSLATFLVTIINITILFFALRAFLLKPVTKFMEDRARKVQDSLDQAEKERLQAKGLLQQYEDRLKRVEEEALEIIRGARETAKLEGDRIIAEAKAQADLLLDKGRRQLEAEQRAAMTVFRADAAALVIGASSRLIRRELNSDDSRRQADLLLKELAGTPKPGEN
ncbi:MAG: F0F1 ATP synthase subunit B [Treponema sp.]|jgi:F-type H+-transporting ATPase subunit b|nr:F0F1 ATP synthase subunit B [Treponema sp.]